MKRIAFVIDQPNLYGSELHVLKLIEMLKERYEIHLIAFSEGPLLEKIPKDVSVKVIKMSWFSKKSVTNLYKYIKQGGFDFIHGHQPKAILWTAIIGKLAGIKAIITIHSLPENNRDSYTGFIRRLTVFTFHTLVLFLSELLSYKIIYLTSFGFARSSFRYKASCIPNWVVPNTSVFKIDQNKSLRLISVGSISYQKGTDRMLDALGLVKDYQWSLDIVGGGDEQYVEMLKNQASNLGIVDKVRFLGYRLDVDELLLQSDYFILLSRGETFGMVYLEAMNSGLSIIAWDIPAVKEIVPSENLIMNDIRNIRRLFEPGYSSLYQNRQLINLARIQDRFSIDLVRKEYWEIYD